MLLIDFIFNCTVVARYDFQEARCIFKSNRSLYIRTLHKIKRMFDIVNSAVPGKRNGLICWGESASFSKYFGISYEFLTFVTMRVTLKIFSLLFLCSLLGATYSCKTKVGHNKYREAKVRPSERQMRADKKAIAKGNRNYKKQMLSNRKRLFGSKRDPQAPRSRK